MGANSLPSISLAVSIAVVICMTITFAILFILYCFSKTRCIRGGVEDETIKTQLIKEYDKNVTQKLEEQQSESGVEPHKIGYCEYLDSKKKKLKPVRVITDIVFVLILVVLFAFAISAMVFRSNGEQFFIGNTAYLTVQTGSMAEKEVTNPYYNVIPDNQIEQYSLIGVDKVGQDDLELYDIIAFKSGDTVYVHRIVGIFEINGEKHFTTIGDANSASMAAETDITFDRIIGKYNGYKSFGMGCLFIYLNSNIGIIALIFAMLFVLTVDLSEWEINRRYEERTYYIAGLLDGERVQQSVVEEVQQPVEEQPTEPIVEEPVVEQQPEPVAEEQVVEPVEEETPDEEESELQVILAADEEEEESTFIEGRYVIRYDRSFTARIMKSDDTVKGWYTLIKNELLSYPKVRASMSWRHESFTHGRKRVARLVVRGRTLCIYLALSPQDYIDTKYKIEDVSEQVTLGELKTLYRIKNERRARYTLQLIADVMANYGVEKGEQSYEDWYMPYNDDATLLEKKLIKKRIVKVLGDDDIWGSRVNSGEDDVASTQVDDEEDEDAPIFDGVNVIRYNRSYTSRLIKSDDTLKEWYGELKNELLSYKKVRATMSWRYESFTFGRNRVARFAIRGRTLCLYLALPSQNYEDSKYKLEDVSDIASLGELTSLYRIKNVRRVKYAKELIAQIMENYGGKKGDQKADDWYMPYEGDSALLEKNLIKRKVVKVSGNSTFWANQVGKSEVVQDTATEKEKQESNQQNSIEQSKEDKNNA